MLPKGSQVHCHILCENSPLFTPELSVLKRQRTYHRRSVLRLHYVVCLTI